MANKEKIAVPLSQLLSQFSDLLLVVDPLFFQLFNLSKHAASNKKKY
jgi:hypothetical protein